MALHQYARQPNDTPNNMLKAVEGMEPEPTMSVSIKANGEKMNPSTKDYISSTIPVNKFEPVQTQFNYSGGIAPTTKYKSKRLS